MVGDRFVVVSKDDTDDRAGLVFLDSSSGGGGPFPPVPIDNDSSSPDDDGCTDCDLPSSSSLLS